MANMLLETIKPRQLVPTDEFRPDAALQRNLRRGMILMGVLILGLGGLAATLPMAGAVIAPGEVAVESMVKRIGHPTGGVIADLLVRDGDHVREGQVLMRLDSTVSGASAAIAGENYDQLLAREARLRAERDSLPAIEFPNELLVRQEEPRIAALLGEERRVFQLRRESRQGQISELNQRVRQTDAEIAGYGAQAASIRDQAGLIGDELKAARELWEKRYTTLQRLNQLERAAVSLRGDEASARTAIAQARAKIAEIRQQVITLEQDARSQAGIELSDVQAKLTEIRQRKVAANDVNDRNVIKSPEDGVVDKLAYTTIGGVVPADNTIMEIVPDSDRMVVNVKIRTSDIDQLRQGQEAALRFSAFNMRTTPEIEGVLDRISADRAVDERTGTAYFRGRITIPSAQLRRLGDLKLKPGMPVEAFVRTGERTMMSYILKPLSDQLERAFREN